jgi:hypothetical protein
MENSSSHMEGDIHEGDIHGVQYDDECEGNNNNKSMSQNVILVILLSLSLVNLVLIIIFCKEFKIASDIELVKLKDQLNHLNDSQMNSKIKINDSLSILEDRIESLIELGHDLNHLYEAEKKIIKDSLIAINKSLSLSLISIKNDLIGFKEVVAHDIGIINNTNHRDEINFDFENSITCYRLRFASRNGNLLIATHNYDSMTLPTCGDIVSVDISGIRLYYSCDGVGLSRNQLSKRSGLRLWDGFCIITRDFTEYHN